jgi:hypothetical protein
VVHNGVTEAELAQEYLHTDIITCMDTYMRIYMLIYAYLHVNVHATDASLFYCIDSYTVFFSCSLCIYYFSNKTSSAFASIAIQRDAYTRPQI